MRDPRTDPAAKDVARKLSESGALLTRIVDSVDGHTIRYRNKPNGPLKECWITTWNDWCKTAEVITKGPE